MERVGVARHLHDLGVAGERPETRALREVETQVGRGYGFLVEGHGAFGAQLGEDAFAVGAHPLLDVSETDVVD